MTLKTEFESFRQRLTDFVDRFEVKGPRADRAASEGSSLLKSMYFSLRDLFTQGVTREGLRDLVKQDLRETFRFFTRGIDLGSLQSLPWFKRYPAAVWKIFLAMAYRLSPARRIAFSLSVFAFVVGGLQFLSSNSGVRWWLIAIVLLGLLLFMELRDKLDLKGDLEIAREIQFGLVPSAPFHQDAISIYCHMRPANTVGGDYYDIIDLENGEVGVVIGDVAGKGMPAALLMALLQGSLRTLIAAGLRGRQLIIKLNAYLYANTPANSLVTLFYGDLNTATGDLCYVNAGHNAPFLIRRDRTLDRLVSTSVVLGVISDPGFEEKQLRLDPGEQLLLFTDGISEAFNTLDTEYGEARLGEFLKNHPHLPQAELIQGIISDVLAFCGDARPTDDMTIMSIARRG